MTPEEARAIAKEAYIYGFPMVDNYRVQYAYFVNKQDPEYKGGWNQMHNTARVYTPEDNAIQTPNSDTPYSVLGADLRAEPLVLTVPPIEQDRYYSLQFVDAYTYNFAYVGSRTTGNGGGKYLLAGPNWKGDKPAGVNEVIRSDTDLALVLYRTQLIGPSDIDSVKKIQAGYQAQPLSASLNQPPPKPAPPIDFVPPLTADQRRRHRSSSRSSTSCCGSLQHHRPKSSCEIDSPPSESVPTAISRPTSSRRRCAPPSKAEWPTHGRN